MKAALGTKTQCGKVQVLPNREISEAIFGSASISDCFTKAHTQWLVCKHPNDHTESASPVSNMD